MLAASRPEVANRVNPGALLALCFANMAGVGAQGAREQEHRLGRYVMHNGATTWMAAEYDGNDLYGTYTMGQAVQTGIPVNSPGAGSSTDALPPAPLPLRWTPPSAP